MITCNIATYSSRAGVLPHAIEAIKNQSVPFDEIRVFSNDYVPELEGVTVHHNGIDYTDKGKFVWLDNIRYSSRNEIYFSCDDDLFYPPDYVETTLKALKRHPGHIVTYHGRKLRGKGRNYYFGHENIPFMATLENDTIIDVPGTGVSAFSTETFIPDIIQHPEQCMADVLLALEAVKNNIPIMCIAHKHGWIHSLSVEQSIYQEHRHRCERQNQICDEILDFRNK